jgi:hypothetical protein
VQSCRTQDLQPTKCKRTDKSYDQDIEKVYKYGDTYVALHDGANIVLPEESGGLKLLGFFPANSILQHYLVSQTWVIHADPDHNECNTKMVAAMVQGMENEKVAAVCRFKGGSRYAHSSHAFMEEWGKWGVFPSHSQYFAMYFQTLL